MRAQTSAIDYIAEHRLDRGVIERHCETLGILPCLFDNRGSFEFADEEDCGARDAAFIGCIEQGELIDITAWPIDQPEHLATLEGHALVLGADQLNDEASWALGDFLPVHRTALRWIKNRCRGVVVLDHEFGFLALRSAEGPLEVEDEAHAVAIDQLINPARFEHQIMVPL